MTKARLLKEFGTRLKRVREERGWTQEALASKASIDRTYIGRLERGCSDPGLLALQRLSAALGVSASSLVDNG